MMRPSTKLEPTSSGLGKALGRMFAGEALFQKRYTAQSGPGQIAYLSRLHPSLSN